MNKVEPHPVYDAPGCGLASYSCLLMAFFLVGVVGISFSSCALVQSAFQRKPYSLVPGNQVEVWRLQPMRDAKLLELLETPLFYHDESRNGSQACAMTGDALLRVEDDNAWRIPFTAMESVKQIRDGGELYARVSTKDNQELNCYFEPGEGVERFVIFIKEQIKIVK